MAGSEWGSRVQQIQASAKIKDVAKVLGMAVTKRGAQYLAICPFHADTKPSLTLYDTPGTPSHYHCFACGAHGDPFALVQQVRGTDFPAAVDWLAQQYGLASPTSGKSITRDKESPNARLHGLQLALAFYRQEQDVQLLAEFLAQRGISEQTADSLEVVAVRGGSLRAEIRRRQNSGEEWREFQGYLEAAGLLRPYSTASGSGSYQLDVTEGLRELFGDDRALLPIRNNYGGLVGFAGRKIDGSDGGTEAPKYLYSAGTPRGEVLYRSHRAFEKVLEGISESRGPRELYIVEGLFDAARLESIGLAAVAILGAQVTKNQKKLILDLSEQLPPSTPLIARVFFDRDRAGIRGAAKLVLELQQRNIVTEYVWPTTEQVLELEVSESAKDPDEIFKLVDGLTANVHLVNWIHPPLLPLLADQLNLSPDDLLSNNRWDAVSRTRRARALSTIASLVAEPAELLKSSGSTYVELHSWADYCNRFFSTSTTIGGESETAAFVFDETARLNLARSLACSGVQRGDMAPDLATWRRLDLGATGFNEGFRSRLQQRDLRPIEPFDAMYVSRGSGKAEPRLKVMPCPEDLVVQQYLMNALLTESHDLAGRKERFSHFIPAVRYYREGDRSVTTGGGACHYEPLSFAYQIDMDVLEGRQPPTGNGIFRPYFHCWRDFISHLRKSGEQMSRVHVLRLDVRRYYDELSRSLVRELLRSAVTKAAHTFTDSDGSWIPLLGKQLDKHHTAETAVDWLCDQSFGYEYFNPATGAREVSPGDRGIPQGPVLSAWLGSLALFPLDDLMRQVVGRLNADSKELRAAYGRYVDDVVLIADSPELLGVMRGRAEDAIRQLSLTLVQKADALPPMSAKEFSTFLTEGRAFAASEPEAEPMVFGAGDGEAGWQMWGWGDGDLQRNTSLHLLHDKRLYDVSYEQALDHLYTALRAPDLRPKDLAKAARWLWLHAALQCLKLPDEYSLWSEYLRGWRTITKGSAWSLSGIESPWEDPAFYALEGLEKLLDLPQGRDPIQEGRADLLQALKLVAGHALQSDFLTGFQAHALGSGDSGWGRGTTTLKRMFWNHALPLRMKAAQLLSHPSQRHYADGLNHSQTREVTLLADSLVRALITHHEALGTAPNLPARAGGGDNPLRDGIIWLHCAFAYFAFHKRSSQGGYDTDPLDGRPVFFQSICHADAVFAAEGDRFIPLLRLLLPDDGLAVSHEPDDVVARLALATLSALASWESLPHLLTRRVSLASQSLGAIPFPALPGIVPDDFLMVSGSEATAECGFLSVMQLKRLERSVPTGRDSHIPIVTFVDQRPLVSFEDLTWKVDGFLPIAELDAIRLAEVDVSPLGLNVYVHPPSPLSGTNSLAVAADIFEALASVNDPARTDPDVEHREYVPAWPFLGFKEPVDCLSAEQGIVVALFCLPIRPSAIGSFGFIRAGSRGLQPVAVPAELAHLWRAGVAVSDLVGLNDDVDKYQASLESTFDGRTLKDDVLLHSMRRLRGCFSGRSSPPPDPEKPHLPATISRVLAGMREFPSDGNSSDAASFAISLRNETNAMAVRLDADTDLDGAGGAAFLVEKAARLTIRALPPAYLDSAEKGKFVGEGLREGVLGWCLLSNRLKSLPRPKLEHVCRAWEALLTGLEVAAITSWLRALVAEISSDDRGRPNWSTDLIADVAAVWEIDNPRLAAGLPRETVQGLSLAYREAIAGSGLQPHILIDGVTPLGWLALVADMLGLFAVGDTRAFSFKGHGGDQKSVELEIELKGLASLLAHGSSQEGPTSTGHENWPFEVSERLVAEVDPGLFVVGVRALMLVDEYCGYTISRVKHRRWSFNPSERLFTDREGNEVPLQGWQVQGVGEGPAWSTIQGDRFVSNWTETRSPFDRLVGVSVLRQSLGRLVGDASAVDVNGPTSMEGRATKRRASSVSGPFDEVEVLTVDGSVGADTEQEGIFVPGAIAPQKGRSDNGEIKRGLRDLQARSWRARAKESDSHVRVAILQWQVEDTYRHPLFDTTVHEDIELALIGKEGVAANAVKVSKILPPVGGDVGLGPADSLGDEELQLFARACADSKNGARSWTRSASLDSWAEHRRRRIIGEALDSCAKFKVDVLVLPEYSVRPDTVAWIVRKMRSRDYTTSVYAGTYRLFGNSEIPGFEAAVSPALGYRDFQQIMLGDGDDPGLVSKGELSSILSLLTPLRSSVLGVNGSLVSVLTRRKKYPSAAANEVFNPGIDKWRPLYNLPAAAEDLHYRAASGDLSPTPSRTLSAGEMLSLASAHAPEQYLAELICSEIFLATSPANMAALAGQHRQLLRRFGGKTSGNDLWEVSQDVLELGKALGPRTWLPTSGDSTSLVRRTILVVPAMTSRSADYWIFGQAGLLAAGLTTVFCNASCGSDAVGGSCVVGHNSWKETKTVPGIQTHITPYSGWSRGIFYNKESDALGKREQALAIVDIDPVYMNEGKPRPQTLCAPLQLVAHLPIIETLKCNRADSDSCMKDSLGEKPIYPSDEFEKAVATLIDFAKGTSAAIWSPSMLGNSETLAATADALSGFTSDSDAFRARLRHWAGNWRDLPWSGAAPAVIDFIWVDHTLSNSETLPVVFVPPWRDG